MAGKDDGGGFVVKCRAEALICQYVGFEPNANKGPDNMNEGKLVGYLTEELEMCSFSQ